MKDIVKILKSIKAIETNDHFVYISGRHGSVYIRKDMLYPNTQMTSDVCNIIAEKFKDKSIDIVVGPSIGGIVLSQWTAYHLTKLKKKGVLGLFTEKDEENNQIFKRGYDKLVKNKNVLIVEDFTTTGSSVAKVVKSVKKAGGKVIAVCVLINRDPQKVTPKTIGAPLSSLGIFNAESFDSAKCPLCKKNVPINTSVGHGKKYLQERNNH